MITGAAMPPKIIEKAIHKPLLLPKPAGFSKGKMVQDAYQAEQIQPALTIKQIHELNKPNRMMWDEMLEGRALQ